MFSLQNLWKHKMSHTTESTHKFRTRGSLLKHKLVHSNKKKYQCDVCLRLEKIYQCDVCLRLFDTRNKLLNHKLLHGEEKKYKCKICSKLFRTRYNLLRHKAIHTNEKIHKGEFRTEGSLLQHKLVHNLCSESSSEEHKLQSHCTVHDIKAINPSEPIPDVAPIVVEVELTDSSESKLLNVSIIYNEQDEIFQTNNTTNSSIAKEKQQNHTVKSTPKIHSRTHMKEKLFSCNLCSESFPGRQELQSHCTVHKVKAIHRSEPMDDVAPVEVEVELTNSSESKLLNESIIYNEKLVEDEIFKTNSCTTNSSVKEIKQEIQTAKLENSDGVISLCDKNLEDFFWNVVEKISEGRDPIKL